MFVKQTRNHYSILFLIHDIYLGMFLWVSNLSLYCSSSILLSRSWKLEGVIQEMTTQASAKCRRVSEHRALTGLH